MIYTLTNATIWLNKNIGNLPDLQICASITRILYYWWEILMVVLFWLSYLQIWLEVLDKRFLITKKISKPQKNMKEWRLTEFWLMLVNLNTLMKSEELGNELFLQINLKTNKDTITIWDPCDVLLAFKYEFSLYFVLNKYNFIVYKYKTIYIYQY